MAKATVCTYDFRLNNDANVVPKQKTKLAVQVDENDLNLNAKRCEGKVFRSSSLLFYSSLHLYNSYFYTFFSLSTTKKELQ